MTYLRVYLCEINYIIMLSKDKGMIANSKHYLWQDFL